MVSAVSADVSYTYRKTQLQTEAKQAKEQEEQEKQATISMAAATNALKFAERLKRKGQRHGAIINEANAASRVAARLKAEETAAAEKVEELSASTEQKARADSKWHRMQGAMRAARLFTEIGNKATEADATEIEQEADNELAKIETAIKAAPALSDVEEESERAERRFRRATNALKFIGPLKKSIADPAAAKESFKTEAAQAKSMWKPAKTKLSTVQALQVRKEHATGAKWAATKMKL